MQIDKNMQEMFSNFILQRVKEDKMEEAKALLAENFKKQDEGTFTKRTSNSLFRKCWTI